MSDPKATADTRDPLTGLLNRDGLNQTIKEAVEGVTIFLVDLDGFKDLNDSWGFAAGDAVLRAVAKRLVQAVGPETPVARIGSDDFVVMVEGRTEDDTATLARAILSALGGVVQQGGHDFTQRASIGVARIESGTDVWEGIWMAGVGLVAAKALGGSKAVFSGSGRIVP